MFDIGFSELVLVAIVALLVVGPERLPRVARVAGMWLARARRSLASVKQEIDRELKAGELAEILKQQTLSNPLETLLEDPSPSATPAPPPVAPGAPAALAPSAPDRRSPERAAAEPPADPR